MAHDCCNGNEFKPGQRCDACDHERTPDEGWSGVHYAGGCGCNVSLCNHCFLSVKDPHSRTCTRLS